MNSTTKIFIIIFIAVSTYGCRKDDFEEPTQQRIYGKDIILSENTYVPEELQNFSEVQVDSNKLVLKFSSSSNLPNYKEGQILVGKEGGGFVRKVVSASVQGNIIIVNTVKAGLDEVFDRLKIDTSFVFSPEIKGLGQVNIEDEVQINGQVYNRTIKSSPIELTKGTSGDLSFTFPNMSFKIETPDKTGVLEIKIKEVKLTVIAAVDRFYIDFDDLLDIKFGLIYKIDMIQDIKEVSCVLKGGVSDQWPDLKHEDLLPTNIPIGVCGIPPLVFTFEFNIAAGIEGKFYASGGTNLITSSTRTNSYLVGAEYLNGGWSPVWEKNVSTPTAEVNFSPTGNLAGEVKFIFLKPKVKIILDKTVGGNIFVRGFVYGEAKNPPISAGIGFGVDGGVGFDLYFIKKKILAFKWVIAEWRWPVIWSYLNNIPVFGTTVNPIDNTFKLPTDVNLQWSCFDPDGDGIKYNVFIGLNPEQLSMVSENQSYMSYVIHDCNYGTRYYWQVEAVDSRGAISRSPIQQFTTIHETSTISDIDGNSYKTVKIGNQWWMAENLRVTKFNNNTLIPQITDYMVWRNLTSAAYDWYEHNELTYKNTFGALYNWYAVDDSRKLCPSGWHVPNIDEINTLETYLITNGYGYGNSINAIAKSLAASSGWHVTDSVSMIGNDQYSNNSSGFAVLPAGFKTYNGGFSNGGSDSWIWSSTVTSEGNPMYIFLGCFSSYLWKGFNDAPINNKRWGNSVRCIKD